jgi:hypothetical protein
MARRDDGNGALGGGSTRVERASRSGVRRVYSALRSMTIATMGPWPGLMASDPNNSARVAMGCRSRTVFEIARLPAVVGEAGLLALEEVVAIDRRRALRWAPAPPADRPRCRRAGGKRPRSRSRPEPRRGTLFPLAPSSSPAGNVRGRLQHRSRRPYRGSRRRVNAARARLAVRAWGRV